MLIQNVYHIGVDCKAASSSVTNKFTHLLTYRHSAL